MDEIEITFNGENYILAYNEQSGYYEEKITAPEDGGVYEVEANFTDLFGTDYKKTETIQILAKEQIKLNMKKVFIWIFDHKDFSVKDIVEIADYSINIDEETNANATINVLKKTGAVSRDLVAVKINNDVVYWGIIKEISNNDGEELYIFTLKYITNMFDQDIILEDEDLIKTTGVPIARQGSAQWILDVITYCAFSYFFRISSAFLNLSLSFL